METEEFKFDLFAAAVEKPIAGFDLLDNIYNLPEAFLSHIELKPTILNILRQQFETVMSSWGKQS